MSQHLDRERRERRVIWRITLRGLAAILLRAVAWAVIVVIAVFCFARRMAPPSPLLGRDVLGFASAFAVAGAISGVVATALFGWPRRALGLSGLLIALLALAVFAIRLETDRTMPPGIASYRQDWHRAAKCLDIGTAFGACGGLIAVGVVGAFALATRRMISRTGVIATLVLIAILWAHVISCLLGWAIPYVHRNVGMPYDGSIEGAAIGAVWGSLAGAVLLGLVARGRAVSARSGEVYPTGRHCESGSAVLRPQRGVTVRRLMMVVAIVALLIWGMVRSRDFHRRADYFSEQWRKTTPVLISSRNERAEGTTWMLNLRMAQKYRRAAYLPFLPIPPDPGLAK